MVRSISRKIHFLFCRHYRAITEEQLLEIDEQDLPRINYDCDEIRKDIEEEDRSPFTCCGQPLQSNVSVRMLYGGRGVHIDEDATCPKCQTHHHQDTRLRDGYIMAKDRNGKWCIFLAQAPLLLKWVRQFLELFKPAIQK